MVTTSTRIAAALVIAGLAVSGCQTAYYAVWEKLGKEKRHLLETSVNKARAEQEQAAEEFTDTLSRLQSMYGFDGGNLETVYRQLERDADQARARAKSLSDRIEKVERIADDLFVEWDNEITMISNARFRGQSRQKLTATRDRFSRLQTAMRKAESSLSPVLTQLNDHVLFLKHNLNAQAIGALKSEMADIESEIKQLIGDMRRSIREADEFVQTLE